MKGNLSDTGYISSAEQFSRASDFPNCLAKYGWQNKTIWYEFGQIFSKKNVETLLCFCG